MSKLLKPKFFITKVRKNEFEHDNAYINEPTIPNLAKFIWNFKKFDMWMNYSSENFTFNILYSIPKNRSILD